VLVLIGIFLRDRPEELGFYPDNAPPDDKTREALERAKQNVINNPWTNKRMLTTKETYFMSISVGILLFGSVGIMAQIAPIVFSKDPAFGAQYLGVVFPLISVVACAGSWLCGFVDQKFGSKNAIIMASIFMMLACILMMVPNIVVTLIGIAFMCIFMGGGSNFATSGIATYWRRSGFARGYRIINSLANILQAVGPALITWVAVAAGAGGHLNYNASFIMCLVMGAISVAAMIGFKASNLRKKEVEWVGHEIDE
jgi:MFS family permease